MSMRLLEPEEIAARRRPLAVLFVFGCELTWSLVVATPAHAWARRVWGAHPDGDATLWVPGAEDLLAWLGPMDAAEAVVLRVTLLLLFVGIVLSQVPLGVLLASLATGRGDAGRAPSLAEARRASASTFLPLLTALALVTAIELVILGIGGALGTFLASTLKDSEIGSLRVSLAVASPFALLALAFGVLGDVVRAAMVRDAAGSDPAPTAWGSLVRSLRATRRIGLRGVRGALGAWGARAAIGAVLIGVGVIASDALGGRGGLALALLFAIHQAVVLGRTALRASWLARAVRLVAPSPAPEPAQPRASDL